MSKQYYELKPGQRKLTRQDRKALGLGPAKPRVRRNRDDEKVTVERLDPEVYEATDPLAHAIRRLKQEGFFPQDKEVVTLPEHERREYEKRKQSGASVMPVKLSQEAGDWLDRLMNSS